MKRILLVDDESSILDFLSAYLEKSGHQVSSHTDAAIALKTFEENPFDAVISDIKMPKMNGIDMAKAIKAKVKLQIPAGAANPAPPVGPALGAAGVNIMDFCKAFNDATKEKQGPIPVVINVYNDRSFDFVTKLAPVSYMIKNKLKLKKGSQAPGQSIIGKINMKQIKEIAEEKMQDLNANDISAAMKIVEGTAKNMGIEVK